MESEKKTYIFKILVVGEGGVGKTTFIKRYATKRFVEDTKKTVGTSFYLFEKKISANIMVTLQVWDFGGEKRFRFILPSYCEGAQGIIFAFDLTRISSLFNLHELYDIVSERIEKIDFIFMGTKLDLVEEMGAEAISDEQIMEFIKTYDQSSNLLIKTSSKTGENIENVFTNLINLIYSRVTQ
ncbi:MAG: Rab family GTPase [Promethearchaeota archaeon]